ncbi:MAG: alkaline phosphatase, partial [Candidatus Sumerlaeota bacterium]
MTMNRIFNNIWRLAPTMVVLLAVLLASACSQTLQGGIETDKRAKNVIVFIGDGMGFNHEDAASCFATGEKDNLTHQKLPVSLAMSTWAAGGSYDPAMMWEHFNNLNKGSTDSAAAGTAMATGRKTYGGAIGVGPDKQRLINVVEWAETKGKSTGVVSSVEFAHATPAAFVAHNEKRHNFEDIAKEMLGQSAVDVLIGCGHPMYDNSGIKRKEANYKFVGGEATWKKRTAGELGADADGDGVADPWSFYDNPETLLELPTKNLPKRIALIPPVFTTLQQRREGDPEAAPFEVGYTKNVPMLHQLTGLALEALGRDEDGFFLMVEGG